MHWRHLDVLLLLIAVTALARGQQSASLVGTWMGSFQSVPVEMVLNADGSGSFSSDPARWRVQSGKLILTDSEGSSQAFDFRLQGSQLILSGGDPVSPMTFTRSGGGAAGSQRAGVREAPQQPEAGLEEHARPESPAPPSTETSLRPSKPAGAKRGLTESDVIHLLDGGVPTKRVMDLAEERGVAFPVTSAAAARLKAKGASDQLIAALRQQAGAPPERIPAQAKTTASCAPAASGGGRRYSHDAWGLRFAVPGDWKVGERGGALLLGSDTEPGLIIIRFMRRTTLQTLAEGYQEGMQEEGLQLMPTTQLEDFSAGGNHGLAGEMAGVGQDGARVRARAVGVAGPFGDAAVIFGLTTEEKYPGLKPRVDALASSLSFAEPQVGPVPEFLAGQYYYISASNFGSTERYINMCSDGRFSSRSGTYSSGAAGTTYGEGGQSAQWTAEGDESHGVIIVTNPDGKTERYEYRRSGSDLIVNGRTFARYGDGACTKTSIY